MMINRQIWQKHHLMACPVPFSVNIHTIYWPVATKWYSLRRPQNCSQQIIGYILWKLVSTGCYIHSCSYLGLCMYRFVLHWISSHGCAPVTSGQWWLLVTPDRRCKPVLKSSWIQTNTYLNIAYMIDIQGGPKKVSHYRESSLNRIKNRQPG